MRERIIKFIDVSGLTAAELADTIGVQRSSVSHVLNGRNNPSFSFIQKMLEQYPSLNSRWLMTGEGEMFQSESKPTDKMQSRKSDSILSTEAPTVSPKHEETLQSEINQVAPMLTAPSDKPSERTGSLPENSKKVVRVLIFYDDHTFEDFRPAK